MKSKGFTIAELIVVIAIIVIVSGVSLYTFSRSQKVRMVEGSAEEIRNLISQAHSLAMNTPNQYINMEHIDFKITTDAPNPTLLEIYTKDEDPLELYAKAEIPAKIDISFANIATGGNASIISFDATNNSGHLGQVINLDPSAEYGVITLTYSGITKNIYVDKLTGNVTSIAP